MASRATWGSSTESMMWTVPLATGTSEQITLASLTIVPSAPKVTSPPSTVSDEPSEPRSAAMADSPPMTW